MADDPETPGRLIGTSSISDDAHCLGCGYSLRGLPEHICPECGRAFDPGDPSTYRQGGSKPYWLRWAAPPKSWHGVVAAACTLGLLSGYSEPGPRTVLPSSPGFCCLSAPAIVLALAMLIVNYAARMTATAFDSTRAVLDRDRLPKGSAARWAVLPLCLIVLASASVTRWPLRARFELSRAALEETAHGYRDGTLTSKRPGRVGLFHFSDVAQQDGGVGFMGDYGFWRLWGLFYSPTDTAPSSEIVWSWRIAPNWFVFEWHF